MHSAALLAQENATLRRANEKKRQKRTRSNRQMPHNGGLTIAEGLQLAQQLEQLVEDSQAVSHEQGDLPIGQAQLRKRAPPTCSGCGVIGHKINQCKNR
jgi:hypothetical protein